MTCKNCGSEMIYLFTSSVCKAECDLGGIKDETSASDVYYSVNMPYGLLSGCEVLDFAVGKSYGKLMSGLKNSSISTTIQKVSVVIGELRFRKRNSHHGLDLLISGVDQDTQVMVEAYRVGMEEEEDVMF